MIEKNVTFNDDAWAKIKSGVTLLNRAVGSTLGPNGKTVILEDAQGNPHVTKDGITVAESLLFPDPIENLAMSTVRQASKKTALRAGDGTTSSIVVSNAIVALTSRNRIGNVHLFKKGMYDAKDYVVSVLKKTSKKLNKKDLLSVASISANNDESIGKLIAEAYEKVGKDGVVAVEQSYNEKSYVTIKEGTKIDRGWATHHLVTDLNKREFVAQSPFIFICSTQIQSAQQILPILQHCAETSKQIIIVSDTSEEFLATMILNNNKGRFKACVIRPPGIGYKRDELLEDLALMTGSKVFSEAQGNDFGQIDTSYLGMADKVVVSEGETVLFTKPKEEGKIKKLKKHIEDLLSDESEADNEWHLRDRLSKLTGGVATVHVGASTEVEMKEKMDRVDDAINATRAALKMGVVPGGGATLLHIAKDMRLHIQDSKHHEMHPSYIEAWDILIKALAAPLTTILYNTGITDKKFTEITKSMMQETYKVGYNALSGELVDMYKEKILDPTAVTINVVENAVSVACELITTDCVVTNVRA
mgnify:CR=1 FL=1